MRRRFFFVVVLFYMIWFDICLFFLGYCWNGKKREVWCWISSLKIAINVMTKFEYIFVFLIVRGNVLEIRRKKITRTCTCMHTCVCVVTCYTHTRNICIFFFVVRITLVINFFLIEENSINENIQFNSNFCFLIFVTGIQETWTGKEREKKINHHK